MTRYVAIFKQADGNEFVIEYQPRYSEKDGCVLIEIVSVTHTKRPANWQEQREEYQQTPPERGIVLDEQDHQEEWMHPYTRREKKI